MLRFDNPNNDEWLNKYNKLVEDVELGVKSFSDKETLEEGKLGLHHIIPRSVSPELKDNKENHIYLPFKEHMDMHYWLWRYDPKYAPQLWFGCVYGRKNGLWDLPGGDIEYEKLKEDVKKYRKRKSRNGDTGKDLLE